MGPPLPGPTLPEPRSSRPRDSGQQDRGLGVPAAADGSLSWGLALDGGVPPAEEQCRLGKKKDGGGWACGESLYLTSIFLLSRTPLKSLSGS